MAGQVISKVATADGGTHLISHSLYGTCTVASTTTAKAVIINDPNINSLTLTNGLTLTVKFSAANGVANPTLQIYTNSGTAASPTQGTALTTTAVQIKRYDTTGPSTSAATSWQANSVVTLTYDGTYGRMNNWLNDNTTYTSVTLGNGYGTCATAAGTTSKSVTLTNYALVAGGRVSVKCTTSNTVVNPTMQINSKGYKAVWIEGAASSSGNPALWDAGDILELVYDGTQYQIVSKSATNAEIDAIINS